MCLFYFLDLVYHIDLIEELVWKATMTIRRMGPWTSTKNLRTRRKPEPGRPAPLSLVRFFSQFTDVVLYNSLKVAIKWCHWHGNVGFTGDEGCERLAYYGMSTNLVNYIKKRLNLGIAASSTTVTNWQGTCYLTPLLGAFLADAYLGRYWTIAGFSLLYIIVSTN